MPEWAFIALGSNLGDRARSLAFGRERIAALPQTEMIAASAIEHTDPIGPVPQGAYLNQMVLVRTTLAPRALLEALLAIEHDAGRRRRERWGPRELDLDLVRYDEMQVDEPGLVLPHPEVAHRPFWQRELSELEAHVR